MAKTDKEQAERERLRALYVYERRLYEAGAVAVAGVDEVGRGALAGPVSAGACVLGPVSEQGNDTSANTGSEYVHYLNDSKKLTARRRTLVATELREHALAWSVAHVAPAVVDDRGIVAAVRLAMQEALMGLTTRMGTQVEPDIVVVDGRPFDMGAEAFGRDSLRVEFVVRGDGAVASIAAASVLAKVARDELMVALAERYPAYGFAGNKGYGSAGHVEALVENGLTDIHRKSFCRNFFR
ncbi:MAG: ribonuclease HII [Actinomycetes bacterium]|nr:ribonuclease HII [Actinomycetes bacterium]